MTNASNLRVWFIEPSLPQKVALTAMQPPLGGIEQGQNPTVNIHEKDIRQIAARLKKGEIISEVEWIIILRSEDKYLLLDKNEQSKIVAIVWERLIADEGRFYQFLLKIIAGLARGYQAMSATLLASFPNFSIAKQSEKTKRASETVKYLLDGEYLNCAKKIVDANLTVKSWFSSFQADSAGEHVNLICLNAALAIGRSPETDALTWWLSCQAHLESKHTLEQLEYLLPKINYVEPRSTFDTWIQTHCLPDNAKTYWYQLSEQSQLKLKSFYHVTTFKSVKKIFDALCDTRIDPSLTDTHVRNLERRTTFWSDYSNCFGRVRFLLTQRSKKLLAQKIDLQQERVTIMGPLSLNDESEICIFEIDNYIFIERFRGSDFDLGVFTKDPILEQQLFDSSYVDALAIAKLTPDWVVDHKDYWQKRLISFLSKKGIKPNKNHSLAKNWFMALTKEEQKQVDEMKSQRNYNNLDLSSYFRIGQRLR